MCVFLNRETPQPMGVGLFSFFQGVFGKSHTNIIYIYATPQYLPLMAMATVQE